MSNIGSYAAHVRHLDIVYKNCNCWLLAIDITNLIEGIYSKTASLWIQILIWLIKNGPICFSGQNSLRCGISPHVLYIVLQVIFIPPNDHLRTKAQVTSGTSCRTKTAKHRRLASNPSSSVGEYALSSIEFESLVAMKTLSASQASANKSPTTSIRKWLTMELDIFMM